MSRPAINDEDPGPEEILRRLRAQAFAQSDFHQRAREAAMAAPERFIPAEQVLSSISVGIGGRQ